MTEFICHIQATLVAVSYTHLAIYRDLDNCWSVVAEAIQTILRREAYPHPYEALKALTRTNQAIDVYKRQVCRCFPRNRFKHEVGR